MVACGDAVVYSIISSEWPGVKEQLLEKLQLWRKEKGTNSCFERYIVREI
ncbi:hypothetical protein ACT7DZ_10775 [Bacillus cereus]